MAFVGLSSGSVLTDFLPVVPRQLFACSSICSSSAFLYPGTCRPTLGSDGRFPPSEMWYVAAVSWLSTRLLDPRAIDLEWNSNQSRWSHSSFWTLFPFSYCVGFIIFPSCRISVMFKFCITVFLYASPLRLYDTLDLHFHWNLSLCFYISSILNGPHIREPFSGGNPILRIWCYFVLNLFSGLTNKYFLTFMLLSSLT